MEVDIKMKQLQRVDAELLAHKFTNIVRIVAAATRSTALE